MQSLFCSKCDRGVNELGGRQYERKAHALKDFEQKKDYNSARSVLSYVIWTEMMGLSDNFREKTTQAFILKMTDPAGNFYF